MQFESETLQGRVKIDTLAGVEDGACLVSFDWPDEPDQEKAVKKTSWLVASMVLDKKWNLNKPQFINPITVNKEQQDERN